jgi:hypothetical protein
MIQLTEQQRQELEVSDPMAIDPQTQQQYVLVQVEVYERWRSILADGTTYMTADVMDKLMAEDDANAPYLAELQHKYL